MAARTQPSVAWIVQSADVTPFGGARVVEGEGEADEGEGADEERARNDEGASPVRVSAFVTSSIPIPRGAG
ncbi:MAG: hypothetical protein ACYDDF_08545 [Thermoplasmatota archaeon]